ncbi:CDP-alcohol phosphatidyltransferase [Trinorchestia longiramus]|nr:CDP-alcohol phosphatidyltransferase [Trinorchestia longiramus]
MAKLDTQILFFVPNLIGYVRLLLVVSAFCFLTWECYSYFVVFYAFSITLDGIDGWAARKLKQCSKFGAWLDVVIDNVSRSLLWAYIHPMCAVISSVEWTVFVCNHQLGEGWRVQLLSQHNDSKDGILLKKSPKGETGIDSLSQCDTDQCQPPLLVQRIFKNNFRSPFGVWAVAGLHVLPLWMMGMKYRVFETSLHFLPHWLPLVGVCVLASGRLCCAAAELWCLWRHVALLISHSGPNS